MLSAWCAMCRAASRCRRRPSHRHRAATRQPARLMIFLIDEDRACGDTQNLLAYLAGALLNYRDEGVEFFPTVVVCDSMRSRLQVFSWRCSALNWEGATGPRFWSSHSEGLRPALQRALVDLWHNRTNFP